MLDFIIDIIGVYFSSGLGGYWFFIYIALLFVCTVPFILRALLRK